MIIVGIDIGLVNLGICKIKVHKLGKYECLMADLVDTTHFKCDRQTCQLRHEACHVDWVSHLLQSYKEDFDKAEIVCIERQPPGGHAASEQLLFAALREKAVLIHPRSFIAWMCIVAWTTSFAKLQSSTMLAGCLPQTRLRKLHWGKKERTTSQMRCCNQFSMSKPD